jgi:hypothetical protein
MKYEEGGGQGKRCEDPGSRIQVKKDLQDVFE